VGVEKRRKKGEGEDEGEMKRHVVEKKEGGMRGG
jgi:hypothetical protein